MVTIPSTAPKGLTSQYPEKGDPVTPCMYVYKAKIQHGRSLDKSIL